VSGQPEREPSSRASWVFAVPWELQLPGGVNQVVMQLFRKMRAAADLWPLLVVASWSPLLPVEKVVDGYPITFMALRAPWLEEGSILAPLKWMALAPLQLFVLLRMLRRQRVAAFNFHYPSLAVFPIALLRWLGLYRGALILSFHGSDLRSAQESDRIGRLLWRFVLRRTTAVVATSQRFAQEVRAFVGDARCPVVAIYNGLDVEHFLAERDEKASLPEGLHGREFVVCIANWQHVKGVDVLLHAFASLSRARPGIALALVGAPGPATDELHALARELGIEDAIWFCESVPHAQVGVFLERARVLCLPSRSESFGVALLEAGAYGVPVVATRVGGIPEIVTDGETGLLVPPEDAPALAKALEQLLSDPDRAKCLGENLRRRVVAEFSWSRAYRDYRELLRARTEVEG